jgi:sugar fermentation stimulation protein A
VRRYKRFFADVAVAPGRTVTVHCPNPGSMLGCAVPGAPVRCSTSDDRRRRLRHTLEMVRIGRTWVGLNTLRANALAARALEADHLAELRGYADLRREVAAPSGSRLDFRLSGHARDPRPLWLEVKSVTLAEGRMARFPDSVSKRGQRHARVLADLRRRGDRAAILFIVQRGDCLRFEPADDIDRAYGMALRAAARAGVEVFAWRAKVTPRAILLDRALPVRL